MDNNQQPEIPKEFHPLYVETPGSGRIASFVMETNGNSLERRRIATHHMNQTDKDWFALQAGWPIPPGGKDPEDAPDVIIEEPLSSSR